MKGSVLTGNSVRLHSGRDTAIRGSTVIADQHLAVQAGRDLTIASAENTQTAASESSKRSSSR